MEGWISLYRKIQEHWLWTKKRKFSQFEAWISLLFKANHKDTKIMLDGKIIEVKRGSFITSEIKLTEEWGWSRNTVRKFLQTLKDEEMIDKRCTTKYTSVSIVNWDLYQITKQENEQQNEQVVNNTLNTDNNDNNIYYINLLNNIREKILKEPNRKIVLIGEMKRTEEYDKLTTEEQDQLFVEAMEIGNYPN